MKKVILGITLIGGLILGGCAQAPREVTLSTSFDEKEAAFIKKKGDGTITGQAFLRRKDGVTVPAAGSEVRLIPVTAHSTERINILRGLSGAGKTLPFRAAATFTNDNPEYYKFFRATKADGDGRFTFNDVATGDYYVITFVYWTVRNSTQGGTLYERVTIQGKETTNVVLSGQ